MKILRLLVVGEGGLLRQPLESGGQCRGKHLELKGRQGVSHSVSTLSGECGGGVRTKNKSNSKSPSERGERRVSFFVAS